MTQNITPFKPLSKQDVADAIGCSIRTVENLVSSGELPPPVTIGRRVFWHPEIFYAWLDSTLRAPPTTAPQVLLEKTASPEATYDSKKTRRPIRANSAPLARMRASQAALLASF
jgi:predicted DNA-binding transcriptional regulator AlpA